MPGAGVWLRQTSRNETDPSSKVQWNLGHELCDKSEQQKNFSGVHVAIRETQEGSDLPRIFMINKALTHLVWVTHTLLAVESKPLFKSCWPNNNWTEGPRYQWCGRRDWKAVEIYREKKWNHFSVSWRKGETPWVELILQPFIFIKC